MIDLSTKNIGVIIQARMGSTRLPGKVLKTVSPNSNITLLEYMVNRVNKSKLIDRVVVATSTNKIDDPVSDLVKDRLFNTKVFRGSENDVLSRFYECAMDNNFDIIVRLTADCPFIDPDVIDKCIISHVESGADYTSNTCPPSESLYPDGSDIEVFGFNTLATTNSYAATKESREHVTFFMWKNSKMFKTKLIKDLDEDLSSFRYTIDYPEDLEVFRLIYTELERKGIFGHTADIVSELKDNKSIRDLNSFHFAGEGWEKYNE